MSESERHRTEDLQAEVAARTADLEDLNARLRSIINSAVDGIIVIDGRGRIESFNPGAERLFGYAQAEVVGHNVSMLMPSPYREEHDGYIGRYQTTGQAKIIGIGREVRGQRKDGATFPLHLSVGEMTIGGERMFTGILHDLSDRVRVEEQLREQTALARLGEMAAVIAHEVKNPLAGVRGAIQVIGARLPSGSQDGTIVTDILARIDALDQLMKDLLLFARPPQPRRAPVEIVRLLSGTTDLLTRDPSLGRVRVEITGGPATIGADAEMLRIIFHNILVNAAQAMHGEGIVRVSVQAVDGNCRVSIADEGPGIPAELHEQIFIPFFTTKSRGSGLGLPTAKRLVEAHGGSIGLVSAAMGTTVTVVLPASSERA
jgi:two-component system, LuxR family, sensor kinase FixL